MSIWLNIIKHNWLHLTQNKLSTQSSLHTSYIFGNVYVWREDEVRETKYRAILKQMNDGCILFLWKKLKSSGSSACTFTGMANWDT